MDPYVIINSVKECIDRVAEYLEQMGLSHTNIKAIGVTNHRETTILWDKFTHKPLYNAIVWLDTRTASTVDELLLKCNNNPNCLKVNFFESLILKVQRVVSINKIYN